MKRIKLNNKGFSLVELICAVAILGIVITPLLHSFVTSSNLTGKNVRISEATLAGKNILEAVSARPIDDFYNEDSTGIISSIIGTSPTDVNVTLLEDKDEEGNFSVALENVKAGNSTYEAKVEFSRGDPASPTSDGLYLINSSKIQLAQFDNMDGVFCQPYETGSNPDILVESEMRKMAVASEANHPDNDLISRSRMIQLIVEQANYDIENPVYARVVYTYRFTYRNEFPTGFTRTNRTDGKPAPSNKKVLEYVREYTVFPGGYVPENKDGSVSIYLMYYPVFKGNKYESDVIRIYNNSKDIDMGEGYMPPYYDDDGNIVTVPLNTYLYKQNPYEYNEATGQYVSDPAKNPSSPYYSALYYADIILYMPEGFQIDDIDDDDDENDGQFKLGTYLYTNAKEGCAADGFTYGIAEISVGDDDGWTNIKPGEALTSNLVRLDDKTKIYNVRVSLYEEGTIVVEDGEKSFPAEAKTTYIIEGTKAN